MPSVSRSDQYVSIDPDCINMCLYFIDLVWTLVWSSKSLNIQVARDIVFGLREYSKHFIFTTIGEVC